MASCAEVIPLPCRSQLYQKKKKKKTSSLLQRYFIFREEESKWCCFFSLPTTSFQDTAAHKKCRGIALRQTKTVSVQWFPLPKTYSHRVTAAAQPVGFSVCDGERDRETKRDRQTRQIVCLVTLHFFYSNSWPLMVKLTIGVGWKKCQKFSSHTKRQKKVLWHLRSKNILLVDIHRCQLITGIQ